VVFGDGPRVADRALVVARPVVPRGAFADRAVVTGRPDRALVVGRPVVTGRAFADRAVALDRRLAARRPSVARLLARGPVVPGRTSVARFVARRAAVADRTVVAGRTPFADRLVLAGHLAGVAVAGRLAAAALRWWRRLLLRRGLAAARLRRSGWPVPPLRGRGAFAPRTTRTLGW
jgi:hypothetical protein